MTESEAKAVVRDLTDRRGFELLSDLCDLVRAENQAQNLIARSTEAAIWSRHLLDSVQLLPLVAGHPGIWIDIGTGGGFPGLAVAAADRTRPVILVEPRRLRADFLRRAVDLLKLDRVDVRQCRVEQVADKAAIISARAVASIDRLFASAQQCASSSTQWLLMRGSDDTTGTARTTGAFHVERSVTDSRSAIFCFTGVPI